MSHEQSDGAIAMAAGAGGGTAWEAKHKKGMWKGPLIPFGSYVEYLPAPTTTRDRAKTAPKSVPGIFLQYAIQSGGVWSGDFVVMSLEEVRRCDLQDPYWPQSITVHRVKKA